VTAANRPLPSSGCIIGEVAQSVEHTTENRGVPSSILGLAICRLRRIASRCHRPARVRSTRRWPLPWLAGASLGRWRGLRPRLVSGLVASPAARGYLNAGRRSSFGFVRASGLAGGGCGLGCGSGSGTAWWLSRASTYHLRETQPVEPRRARRPAVRRSPSGRRPLNPRNNPAAVTRALLAVIPVSVALAACGGSDDSDPVSGATRPEPTTQRSTSPPPSPDAGIGEGHAVADARRHRCRALRPPRFWRHCARSAR
jgi:hypothetical protein